MSLTDSCFTIFTIYTVSHKNGANLVLSVTLSNINKF